MTKMGNDKEIMKINVAYLHLRLNYYMSIALETESSPETRQTWVQKIAPAFITSVALGKWLNSGKS